MSTGGHGGAGECGNSGRARGGGLGMAAKGEGMGSCKGGRHGLGMEEGSAGG